MFKKLLCTALLMASQSAVAGLINVELDANEYQVNDIITANIVISDNNEILSGAFAELLFNSASLALIDFSFGNAFDDGLGSYQYADDSILGSLYLEDYADINADTGILASLQTNGFVFATVQLQALTAGVQMLDFSNSNSGLFDLNDNEMQVSYRPITFNVTEAVAQVPAPATLALFGLGLAGLVSRRKNLAV